MPHTNLIRSTCSILLGCCPPATLRAFLLRSLLIVLVTCAAAVPGSREAAGAEPVIVAWVNGEPLHRDEVQKMLAHPLTRYQFEQEIDSGKADSKELERLVLQQLIHRRLILQEARRRNITVTEEELGQALSALRGRFKDIRDFGVWMKERGLDDKSLFTAIRDEMLINRVRAALVEGVRLTEDQVREYYESHKEELTIDEEVRLRIIAVKSRAAAEEALEALRKGEKFSRVARKRSMGRYARRGGDMGWVKSQGLPPQLQRAIGMIKAGDIAGPLQKSDEEFLIVGLQDRRPVKAQNQVEARPEIERRLLPAKQQEAVRAWLAEHEQKSKIEILTEQKQG